MSYEFRMPNVTGKTVEEQVGQIVSFLRQHIQELNFALKSMEGKAGQANGQSSEVKG